MRELPPSSVCPEEEERKKRKGVTECRQAGGSLRYEVTMLTSFPMETKKGSKNSSYGATSQGRYRTPTLTSGAQWVPLYLTCTCVQIYSDARMKLFLKQIKRT